MPSNYRGPDDDSHLWRIEVGATSRPSKRRRMAKGLAEMGGLEHGFEHEGCHPSLGFPSRSSSSLSSSSVSAMATESYDEDESFDDTVQGILRSCLSRARNGGSYGYFSADEPDGQEQQQEQQEYQQQQYQQQHNRQQRPFGTVVGGLDRLWHKVAARNNKDASSRNKHRLELLGAGGHWMLTDLLDGCTESLRGIREGEGHGRVAGPDAMDEGWGQSYGDGYGNHSNHHNNNHRTKDSLRDREERLAPVVVRCCQILRELLSTDPGCAGAGSSTSMDDSESERENEHERPGAGPSGGTTNRSVRYQIYCAGSLDAVVEALRRFPSNFDVHLAGCQFLSRLVTPEAQAAGPSPGRAFQPSPTLVGNLYRATDGLGIVLRLLVGRGGDNGPFLKRTSDRNAPVGDTELWQLYFVATGIVRGVLGQPSWSASASASAAASVSASPSGDRLRSELVRTVHELFVGGGSDGGSDNDGDEAMATDGEELGGGWRHRRWQPEGRGGLEKHMYEHLMTILVGE